MPELPEVQTIVSDLNRKIKSNRIVGFWSDHKKAIKGNHNIFIKEIIGRKIIKAERIGKNILINLSGGKTIHIHLKMTGHLLVKLKVKSEKLKVKEEDFFDDKVNQYIHHIWYLESPNLKYPYDKTLEFSDLRKFGRIALINKNKIKETVGMKKLGVDAIDEKFTSKNFGDILDGNKNKKIRDILMDQKKISGIGNIYASEILYVAGILPERRAFSLGVAEKNKLRLSIRKVLQKAIKMRGTSSSDFRDTSGAPGNFQKALKVYQKTGKKCKKCGSIIKRIKMGQRSAFYCPGCQK